jgi:hypothetical protein
MLIVEPPSSVRKSCRTWVGTGCALLITPWTFL